MALFLGDEDRGVGDRCGERDRDSSRSADVAAAVGHEGGDPREPIGVCQQLAILEEPGIRPVVRHEPSEAQAKRRILVPETGLVPVGDRDMAVFPLTPRIRCRAMDRRIRVQEPFVVRRCEVPVPPVGRQGCHERFPRLGEHLAHRTSHPVDLASAGGHDAAEQELGDRTGVGLRVRQAQGRSPRSAPHQPRVDAEVSPQGLDVSDEVRGGVGRQVDHGVASEGRAAPALALIEADQEVPVGIEMPAMARHQPAPRPPVHQDSRLAVGIAGSLPVDVVAVTDIEHAGIVCLGGLVGTGHPCLRARVPR